MTSGTPRTPLHRSALVRQIAGNRLTPADYDLGGRLGQWLDFTDALALYSLLHGQSATVDRQASATPWSASEACERLRRLLSTAITEDGVFQQNAAGLPPRHRFPTPLPGADSASAADFAPYHRYYLAHQRDLSVQIAALRQRLRQQLATLGGAAQRLAALDAFFDDHLAARERSLLGTVPMHLAGRFEALYAAHRAHLPADAVDDPAAWTTPGSWLHLFCRELQAWLLAELDVRLQPLAGLVAALVPAAPEAATPSP